MLTCEHPLKNQQETNLDYLRNMDINIYARLVKPQYMVHFHTFGNIAAYYNIHT